MRTLELRSFLVILRLISSHLHVFFPSSLTIQTLYYTESIYDLKMKSHQHHHESHDHNIIASPYLMSRTPAPAPYQSARPWVDVDVFVSSKPPYCWSWRNCLFVREVMVIVMPCRMQTVARYWKVSWKLRSIIRQNVRGEKSGSYRAIAKRCRHLHRKYLVEAEEQL